VPSVSTTTDTLLGGSLPLRQPKNGYRVNVDSLLLVAFAGTRRVERLRVLGRGVGPLGFFALHQGLAKRALLIETDAQLALLAQENLERGGFAGQALQLDLTRARLRESGVPLVFCNPPYYPAHSHRPAQSKALAIARSGDVEPFLAAAAACLARKTGRALFCYPAPQLSELFTLAARQQLVPKRLRLVHARANAPARLALLELRVARPGGLVIEPPLFEWHGRKRSPELLALSAGPARDRR
jgi:tRNA1Val (adenine37-N6)-methyltransferase